MVGGGMLESFRAAVRKLGSEINTPIALVDLLVGTYSVPLRFNQVGQWKIS